MTGTAALVQPSAARVETHFDWSDPLLLDEALSEDERMVRDSAHAYCQEKLFRESRSQPARAFRPRDR
jgi:hypothetical protein